MHYLAHQEAFHMENTNSLIHTLTEPIVMSLLFLLGLLALGWYLEMRFRASAIRRAVSFSCYFALSTVLSFWYEPSLSAIAWTLCTLSLLMVALLLINSEAAQSAKTKKPTQTK